MNLVLVSWAKAELKLDVLRDEFLLLIDFILGLFWKDIYILGIISLSGAYISNLIAYLAFLGTPGDSSSSKLFSDILGNFWVILN